MKRIALFLIGIFVCAVASAQTETTKWYIEGELYTTTSCESGGNITMPQTPERFGYTFSGWEPAVYDMSTLDTSIKGSSYTQDNSAKKWSVTFSYGTVYGESLCSPTSNDSYVLNDTGLDTITGEGQYCWCRIIEFIPSGDNKIYEPMVSSWEFRDNLQSISNCDSRCTNACFNGVYSDYGSLRHRLYGIN